jgi:hypothetical protein
LQHSSVCRCYFSCCKLPLLAQINTRHKCITESRNVCKL